MVASRASEMWLPRCPQCGSSNVILAPANGFTKFIVDQVEVGCNNCPYRARLKDEIKRIYIRV